jgi:imidazolonepropionase
VSAPLAIVNCSQVLTLAGPPGPRTGARMRELGIVENGALLVEAGRIAAVGTRDEIERRAPADCEWMDAGGRIALPGFVDAHTHAVFAGHRADEFDLRNQGASYQEIAAAGGGIRSTVRRTREAGDAELLAAARRHEEWFLRNGTTTVEAKSGYGLSFDQELRLLRLMGRMNEDSRLRWVPTFLGAHETPDEYRGRRAEYVRLVCEEMLPAVAREKLAAYCDAFCEPAVFGVEECRNVLGKARALGLGLRLHADQLGLSGGARLAAEMGAATADHLEHTDAAGIEALRAARVQPVLLPGSVYALGSRRYPDARAIIAAGLGVVLATDFNPGSSPTPSIPMILSLASTQMKMTVAEGIAAATVNAAWSLGLGAEAGSLESGKSADIVVHDCGDFRELACFFGVEHAWMTMVRGNVAWRRRTG